MILIFWIVAACYAYGALVHVMNMFGLMGFHWPQAPLKWQVLDVTYLVLDLVVAVGFILAWKASYVAFYGAALSQVLLYTVFRRWILDVPPQFAVAPDQVSYLNTLVILHIVTIVCVTAALWLTDKNGWRRTWFRSVH